MGIVQFGGGGGGGSPHLGFGFSGLGFRVLGFSRRFLPLLDLWVLRGLGFGVKGFKVLGLGTLTSEF